MSKSPAVPSHRRNQRGIAFTMVGIALLAFMAFAVIGVDVGRLAFTASEVQAVADVAATAGAGTLLNNRKTGLSDDPKAQALTVVADNRVNGEVPTMDEDDIELGTFDLVTGEFVPGASIADANAVRATSTETVQNFVAAVIGDPESTVSRNAIASLSGPCGKRVLPIAISDCIFAQYQGDGDCSSLPQFVQVPTPTETACWTSLSDSDPNNVPTLQDLIGNCDSTTDGAELNVGDSIRLGNGQMTPVVGTVASECSGKEFVIPVIESPCGPCMSAGSKCPGQCTGSATVVGFATVNVAQVFTGTGGPDNQCPLLPCCSLPSTDPNHCDCSPYPTSCVKITSLCRAADDTSRGGCEELGTQVVTLVR